MGSSETFHAPGDARSSEQVAVTTEDYGSVLLRLANNIRGGFHVSQMFAGRKNRLLLEVAGTDGAMAWDSESPEVLWLGRRDGPNSLLSRDPSLLTPEAAGVSHYPGGHAEGFPDSFKQLYLAIYSWIAGGADGLPTFPTFAEGHREVLLCEAIAASAREGRWTEVVA